MDPQGRGDNSLWFGNEGGFVFPLSTKCLNLDFAGTGNSPNIHVVFGWNILSFGDFIE